MRFIYGIMKPMGLNSILYLFDCLCSFNLLQANAYQEKEDKKIKQLPSIDSASPQKPSSLQKEKNSRLPEYSLVALLGSKT